MYSTVYFVFLIFYYRENPRTSCQLLLSFIYRTSTAIRIAVGTILEYVRYRNIPLVKGLAYSNRTVTLVVAVLKVKTIVVDLAFRGKPKHTNDWSTLNDENLVSF